MGPFLPFFDRFEIAIFGVKQVQKLCKMGCLLVKWVVQVKWDGFVNFQSLFIIFYHFIRLGTACKMTSSKN